MNTKLVERGEPYNKKNWYVIRIRYFIITVINKFPRLKKIVFYLWDNIKVSIYKITSQKRSTNKDNEIEVDKLYWIDPKKIRYVSLKEFDVVKYKGKIIGGDWDLLERPFDELDIYVAFRERLIEGKKWETTVFYMRILNEIKQGKYLWDCKDQLDFDNRLKKLEVLFETIKKNGYKSQQELHTKNNLNPILIEDEVAVNIGRNGDLLFNNGAHRLSIAKLLNIPEIPIKITVRHPQWINLKKHISDLES